MISRRAVGNCVSGGALGAGMWLVTDQISWRGIAASLVIAVGMMIGEAIRRAAETT